MAGGYFDGYSWVDSRGSDHSAGRMKQILFPALTVIAVVLAGDNALAGATTTAPDSQATSTPTRLSKEAAEKAWSFSASASTYIVPNDQEYVQPTLTADRGWLHLETRYNYENLETGSAWVGYNFSGGEKLEWAFTPMLAGGYGNTTGIAPGYKRSRTSWEFEFSTAADFVFDTGSSDSNSSYD